MVSSSSVTALEDTPPIAHDVSDSNISEAKAEFAGILGLSFVLDEVQDCLSRSRNAWMLPLATNEQRPALVLLPSNTQDVSDIMRICSKRRIPVNAYSGGTSLPGSLLSTRGGACIDFKRMDKVLSVNKADMDAIVQPGLNWMDLNRSLEGDGLFFPPDPSPDARIGGMIAMSCAGTNAYRYGTMKEWVIALTVVLADGTVIRTKRRPRKSSAGYDLTHIFIGSEGTLGIVTEAVIKLTALPQNLHVSIATFPDFHAAVRMGLAIVNSGILVDAIELLDDMSIRALNISNLSKRYWDEMPTVFIKYSGSQHAVEDQIKFAKEAAENNSCGTFEATGDRDQIEILWGARKSDGKAALAMKKSPSDVFIPSDAAVPISRVADLMDEARRLLDEAGIPGSMTAHLGDGNLHVKIVCEASRKPEGDRIISQVEDIAVTMDGTVSGEHGVGIKLRDKLAQELGSGAVDLMRQIKLSLDPQCILNCDKVVRLSKEV